MIKALIRAAIAIAVILVLAQYVPFIAEHQNGLLLAAVALSFIGVIAKFFIILILFVAGAIFFFHII